MLKKILTYGFVEGISKGLNRLLYFVLPLILINTEEYGLVGLILTIEVIAPFLLLLGLEKAILRFYGSEQEIDSKSIKVSVTSLVTIIHLLLIGILLAIRLLGYDSILTLKIFPDIIVLVLLVYLNGLNIIYLNTYRASGQHLKYQYKRLFIQTSKFFLVILNVYMFEYLGYLIGATIAALMALLIFSFDFIHDLDLRLKKSFQNSSLKLLLTFSWPFIFHGLALNLLNNVDKFIIASYMDLNSVGLYTFVYSFGSMIVFSFLGITVYIEPLIYKSRDQTQRNTLLNKFIFFGMIFGLIGFLGIILSTKHILPFLYNEDYSLVLYMIPMISISFLLQPFYLKANYTLIFEKKGKLIAIISIATCLLNIILNVFLIPEYGIKASIFVTFISNLIQYLLFVFASYKFKLSSDLIVCFILGILFGLILFLELNIFFASIPLLIVIVYYFINRKRLMYA
jgi:O-antigen/teichoic acid export membrane protein